MDVRLNGPGKSTLGCTQTSRIRWRNHWDDVGASSNFYGLALSLGRMFARALVRLVLRVVLIVLIVVLLISVYVVFSKGRL